MLKFLTRSLLLTLGALTACAVAEQPDLGMTAPELEVGVWFNSEGADPSIAGLKGKAILIEFWATW